MEGKLKAAIKVRRVGGELNTVDEFYQLVLHGVIVGKRTM